MSKQSSFTLASFTRRQALAAAAATPLALMSGSRDAQAADAKPNILYIMADDMGYADVSCFGRREYTTTNIDKLAANGARLTQAYANSAVCSATRTALITGRYQDRLPIGLEEPLNGRSKEKPGLPPSHPTLPSLLKKVGYTTALIGKWHLGGLPEYGPLKSGYDHFWGFRGGSVDYFTHKGGPANTNTGDLWDGDMKIQESGYLTDLLGTHAVAAIDGFVKEKKPFFMSLHFNAPHWPWEGPNDQAESQRLHGGLFDFDGGSMKTYARMVLEMDATIGRVVKALEAAGVANNTIIIFTSDNGGERFADTWPFTGKKTELLEGGLRIPAIVHWPKHIRAKSTVDQVAITMDWVPTLLSAAGAQADPAYPLDGMSLLPQLTQRAAPVPRKLFWRFKAHLQRAMRDGDMKYLKIGPNTFLFNVVDDPLERANLKNRQPEVYVRMAAAYDAWDATMLPYHTGTNSDEFTGSQLADHFGVEDD
jgi:arylsulfatase A-like enzyme